MDKEYVVTLHRKEDLEQFYNEMQLANFPLVLKRPLSRNTHYMMTEEQAEQLRQDPRVWGVEAVDSFIVSRQAVFSNEPYTVSGNFWKGDTVAPATVSPFDYQWGHIHCAGSQAQRGKGQFGSPVANWLYEQVNSSVEVFNSGRDVDVIIVDDPVSYDSEEWYSPTTNETRFVPYQWFDELNSFVSSIDDDGQVLPTGTITYDTNSNLTFYHGNHVTGTACGQHYGWARESNIYNMAVTGAWSSGQQFPPLLIFDYLRAFHLNKTINPSTGKRNPTITNHSYGGIIPMPNGNLTFEDVTAVQYQGVVYNSGNPGPSGWTQAGLEADFGVRFGVDVYPSWSAAVSADVIDAIADGVVIIGAAGNDNLLFETVNGPNWNNLLQVSGVGTFYYMRGGWPNSPDSGSINVGALSNKGDFRRSVYTNYGPAIDVFAPGDLILSSYDNTGLNDTKYNQGSGNYFYPISGTSMASPQVCGIAACLASGKERFTQNDLIGYLQKYSINGDMTFDLSGGGYTDNSARGGSPNRYLHLENPRKQTGYIEEVKGPRFTGQTFPRRNVYFQTDLSPEVYNIDVFNNGSTAYILTGSDRLGEFVASQNQSLNVRRRDLLIFTISAGGHPFWIKTAPQTSTGFVVDVNTTTNNGTDSGVLTWDTSTIEPGTYYYICQFHGSMLGSITVT